MLNNKLILNGVLAFSIISLTIAYYIQYILGHKPCNLCLIERIPYISAIILVSLIFIIKKFEKSKGWVSQKLSSSNNQLDHLTNILDEKSIWQRYGL